MDNWNSTVQSSDLKNQDLTSNFFNADININNHADINNNAYNNNNAGINNNFEILPEMGAESLTDKELDPVNKSLDFTFTPDPLYFDPRFEHYINAHMETIKNVLIKACTYDLKQKIYLKDLKKSFGNEVTLNIQDLSVITEFVQQASERLKLLLVETSKTSHVNRDYFEIFEIIKYYYDLYSRNLMSNWEFNNFKVIMFDLFNIAFPGLNKKLEEEISSLNYLIQKNSYEFVRKLLKIITFPILSSSISVNRDPRKKIAIKTDIDLGEIDTTKWITEDPNKPRQNFDQTIHIEHVPLKIKYNVAELQLNIIQNYTQEKSAKLVLENEIEEEFEKNFEYNLPREKFIHEINEFIKSCKPCEMIRIETQNSSTESAQINQENAIENYSNKDVHVSQENEK